MIHLSLHNPFNAPVYHEDTVDSTMNVSRVLAQQGEPHGTVICADYQNEGRGRIQGRQWDAQNGESLLFTVLLRYPRIEDIPTALTLRTGLAVSLAIEDFIIALSSHSSAAYRLYYNILHYWAYAMKYFSINALNISGAHSGVLIPNLLIKWPNDILIADKKLAGVLTEADAGNVHIGIGVNVTQKEFPEFLQNKATSISLAANREIAPAQRYTLLEQILNHLYAELESGADWHSRINARLYKKGEQIRFMNGPANSGKLITGILTGIGSDGALLITPDNSQNGESLSYTTGEIIMRN